MFDQLVDLASSASIWAYAAVFVVAAFDALVPLVPSETALIAAGVVAATGALELGIVIAAGALGAAAGDNAAYAVGRRYGNHVMRRVKAERIAWAERQLNARSAELFLVARFVPGGRTAVTLTAGTVRFRWRRFVVLDAIAALLWATYAAGLGFVGGEAFEQAPWKGLVLALVLASLIALVGETVRRLRKRRSRQ